MKTKDFLQKVKIENARGTNNVELMAYYIATTGQTEFKTFKQWKEAGYKVKKGESSYPVFSRPINAIKAERQGIEPGVELNGRNYFGVAHLFHAGQVEKI